jgi:hypothetical protein
MNKTELQHKLKESHTRFIQYIQSLSTDDFLYSHNTKWTAGQQLEHILKSTSPVKTALTLPAFLLRRIFGKANRPSRSYNELIEKYQSKLAEGGKSTSRFLPAVVKFDEREKLIRKLQDVINSLTSQVAKFSESELDTLILPHPLLGKLTLREMLGFTIYHVGHHEKHTRENLQKRSTP